MSPDSVLHMLHRVLKRAGLPKVRFHDLRHTFATLALQNGVDIKTVKKLMEEETWLDGTKAAEYFQVKVGEENTIAAAVQDFTKMYCRNAPKDLVGAGAADNEQLRQQDQEKRKSIIALTMAHMGQ